MLFEFKDRFIARRSLIGQLWHSTYLPINIMWLSYFSV